MTDYTREAVRLVEQAHHFTYGDGADPVTGAALATEAQVYATLAVAATGAAEVDRLRSQVAELESRLGAVLAPHTLYDDSKHCQFDGEPWPCRAVRAGAEPSVMAEANAHIDGCRQCVAAELLPAMCPEGQRLARLGAERLWAAESGSGAEGGADRG